MFKTIPEEGGVCAICWEMWEESDTANTADS